MVHGGPPCTHICLFIYLHIHCDSYIIHIYIYNRRIHMVLTFTTHWDATPSGLICQKHWLKTVKSMCLSHNCWNWRNADWILGESNDAGPYGPRGIFFWTSFMWLAATDHQDNMVNNYVEAINVWNRQKSLHMMPCWPHVWMYVHSGKQT